MWGEYLPRAQMTAVDRTDEKGADDRLAGTTARDLFDTNFFGPLDLTDRISRAVVRNGRGGSILFITSIHQWVVRRMPAYSASKAALGMVIRELALELAPHSIRVNGIAPGYVTRDKGGKPVPHRHTPLYGSSVDPSYIGKAAVFLASDTTSRFTTGSVLTVDAGLSLYSHLANQETHKT